jgi:hypothetical protein
VHLGSNYNDSPCLSIQCCGNAELGALWVDYLNNSNNMRGFPLMPLDYQRSRSILLSLDCGVRYLVK